MIKLDMSKLIKDLDNKAIVEDCVSHRGGDSFNITRYIFNYQENTKMWDYVNQDVSITYFDDGDGGNVKH